MHLRETLMNLAITFVLVLILVLVAILMRQSQSVPVAKAVSKATAVGQAAEDKKSNSPVAEKALPEFKVYLKPRLVDSKNNEADTLRIVPAEGEAESVFTLYFVDAPDMTLAHPQRVQEQARWFETTQDKVMKTGVEAAAYVIQLLKENPFVLLTRWESVPDRSRYYGLILVQLGNKRVYLTDLLMQKGYARLAGTHCVVPGLDMDADAYGRHLRDLGKKAHEMRIGAFKR